MGAVVNSSHNITASSPSGRTPHTFPLHQDGPTHGRQSPLWTTPMWVLLKDYSSLRTALVWDLTTGCSPSGCSSMSPTQNHKFCQQICSRMDSSFHRPTEPATVWTFHRVMASFRHPPASLWGSSFTHILMNIFSPFPLLKISNACYYRHELLFLQRNCRLEGKWGLLPLWNPLPSTWQHSLVSKFLATAAFSTALQDVLVFLSLPSAL